MSDPYRTLEIKKNATIKEIKVAYRRLAKKYHPDKNKSENAKIIFNEINKAYHLLIDPEKKSAYEEQIHRGKGGKSGKAEKVYRPLYKESWYSKSTIRKGKIFGFILLVVVIVVPFLLLRFSSSYNYEQGLKYYEEGQLPLALVHFDQAIKEFGSKNMEACLKAISICYDRGYISQGIAFAQKGSSYIYSNQVKGNLAYRKGLGWEMLEQIDKADKSFKEALKLGYSADSVYIHLGMIHGFELTNYKEAIGYFDHLIDDSGLREFKLQRGLTFQKAGNISKAIKDLEDFTQGFPENGMGYFFLGISMVDSDNLTQACQYFRIAEEKGVDQSDAYLRLYCEEINQ